LAPASRIAVALAMKVKDGTITSSPEQISASCNAAQRATEPFWQGVAASAPQ